MLFKAAALRNSSNFSRLFWELFIVFLLKPDDFNQIDSGILHNNLFINQLNFEIDISYTAIDRDDTFPKGLDANFFFGGIRNPDWKHKFQRRKTKLNLKKQNFVHVYQIFRAKTMIDSLFWDQHLFFEKYFGKQKEVDLFIIRIQVTSFRKYHYYFKD